MAMLEFFRGGRSSRRLESEVAVQPRSYDEAKKPGLIKGVEVENEVPYKPSGLQEQIVEEVTMPRHQATYITSPYQIQLPYSKWEDTNKAFEGAEVPTAAVVGSSAVPVEERVHAQELALKRVQEGVHGEHTPAVPPLEEKPQAKEEEQHFWKEKEAAEMDKESFLQAYTAREDKAKEPLIVVTEEGFTGGKVSAEKPSLADRLFGTPSRKKFQNPVPVEEDVETYEPSEVIEEKGGYGTWSGDLGVEGLSFEPEGKKLSEKLFGKPEHKTASPAHSGELTGHTAQVLHLSPSPGLESNKASFIPTSGEVSASSGEVSGYYNTPQGVPDSVEEFSHGTQSFSSEGNAEEESSKTEEPEIQSAQPVDTSEEKVRSHPSWDSEGIYSPKEFVSLMLDGPQLQSGHLMRMESYPLSMEEFHILLGQGARRERRKGRRSKDLTKEEMDDDMSLADDAVENEDLSPDGSDLKDGQIDGFQQSEKNNLLPKVVALALPFMIGGVGKKIFKSLKQQPLP